MKLLLCIFLIVFLVLFDSAPALAQSNHTDALSTENKSFPFYQGFNAFVLNFYETSKNDPSFLEVFGYTDKLSYSPGETVSFHVSTTAEYYDLVIVRDGGVRKQVYEKRQITGKFYRTPDNASEKGCGWPVSVTVKIPANWRSGAYIAYLYARNQREEKRQEAFFVVRASKPGRKAKIVQILTTSTWIAYNDWGGSNSYLGISGPNRDSFSPELSIHRPWGRGIIEIAPNHQIESTPRQRFRLTRQFDYSPVWLPYAYTLFYGYSRFSNSAGWGALDRWFSVWAEKNGYGIEYVTQHDLHLIPGILNQYKVAVIVGHDEYWSWEMRKAMDAFVEGGGKLVRLAGNFLWQVRLSNDGSTQTAYKSRYQEDPVFEDPERQHLLTDFWEAKEIDWPAIETVGLTAVKGTFAQTVGATPRGTGGFTVYRPDHWAFQGTDLYYGDVFGDEESIVGFEVDGLSYTFKNGLPYPAKDSGALPGSEILALAPGMIFSESHGHAGEATELTGAPDDLPEYFANRIFESPEEEDIDSLRRGSAMILVAQKGKGEIFTAGTVHWVYGLRWGNVFVEKITRNVLDRYLHTPEESVK